MTDLKHERLTVYALDEKEGPAILEMEPASEEAAEVADVRVAKRLASCWNAFHGYSNPEVLPELIAAADDVVLCSKVPASDPAIRLIDLLAKLKGIK